MRLLILLICAFLSCALHTLAQEVPQRVLDTIISHETRQGMKLELLIPPDFSRPEAPNHTYLGQCYPGKVLMVVIVMAKKSSDLVFNVTSIAKVGEVKPLQEFKLEGKTYWLDLAFSEWGKEPSIPPCVFLEWSKEDSIPQFAFSEWGIEL